MTVPKNQLYNGHLGTYQVDDRSEHIGKSVINAIGKSDLVTVTHQQ